jgi:FAD/FMN-containing dehydrogenase/Fe-S oxidoreductase
VAGGSEVSARAGAPLEEALRRGLRGRVLFDAFSRGRYATDASIYQLDPIGVVVPASDQDALTALGIAAAHGVPILPRGAGSSQCGQSVGEALVIDTTRHLDAIADFDAEARTVWVEPGVVLDRLNAWLKPHGLWFPVDVSTSAQATIGGMAGNNSCGARSLRYGNMVHNVLAIDAWLSDGALVRFGEVGARGAAIAGPARYQQLIAVLRALVTRERAELLTRIPNVQRRVAGYNLDMASIGAFNMAHLLVGSEGTLAWSRRLKLKLAPLPPHKVLGIVHFGSFHDAMDATRHIVQLGPDAVELVDRTMIGLSREIEAFRETVDSVIRGEPDAILLVEFAGEDAGLQRRRLEELDQLISDLGYPDSVVMVTDAARQRAVWEVRKAGLNIMMSMKGDRKPVSFIEDCAVPLEHLAEYTARLTEIFARHGTQGTFYAHASVGCLHVRPVLDMRDDGDVARMRAIAEEACEMVRAFKGSYSGEHGDGLVRSEWIEPVYGPRLATAFAQIKREFDPRGLMNPGKIVAAPKMDDRTLFRYRPGYRTAPFDTALDWSGHEVGEHNRGRGFAAAVEMCNNNGHCRKFDAGTMCPSFHATRDERDVTRGRANTLRLALSGQLGPDALTSREMYETMALCVSCKACRRECPTGVDMARMKIEFLHLYHQRHPRKLRDRLVASLPRYAPLAARVAPLVNLRDRVPGLPWLMEKLTGIAAQRSLPKFRFHSFRDRAPTAVVGPLAGAPEVLLLADTFNRYFEPANLEAAVAVLRAAGRRPIVAGAGDGRPLCCGRTYLAAGMVPEARREAGRLIAATRPYIDRGVPLIGLEPACLLGLRDEYRALLPGEATEALAESALTFEEYLVREHDGGRLALALKPPGAALRARVHGHCHQKSFDLMPSVTRALRLIPELEVETIQAGCCGMAGAFGLDAATFDVSMRIGEAALLPAARATDAGTVLVADGTSCRHQILDGAGRDSVHSVQLFASALTG